MAKTFGGAILQCRTPGFCRPARLAAQRTPSTSNIALPGESAGKADDAGLAQHGNSSRMAEVSTLFRRSANCVAWTSGWQQTVHCRQLRRRVHAVSVRDGSGFWPYTAIAAAMTLTIRTLPACALPRCANQRGFGHPADRVIGNVFGSWCAANHWNDPRPKFYGFAMTIRPCTPLPSAATTLRCRGVACSPGPMCR